MEETKPTEPAAASPKAKRSAKSLPTDRIALDTQLEILRGYAAASGDEARAVSTVEAAKLAKVHESTPSLVNSFFVDAGLLQREGKKYRPTSDVFGYQKAWTWNQETAACKLSPTLRRSWFWLALKPMLAMGPVERTEVIPVLADAAGASVQDKEALALLLKWLEKAELLVSEGSRYRSIEAPNGHREEPLPPSPTTPPGGAEEKHPKDDTGANAPLTSQPWMTILLNKFPNFDPGWSEELKQKWFEAFEKLMTKGGG